MKDEICLVVENTPINRNYFLMKLEAPYITQDCQPGNFVMLTVAKGHDPILKRPFGIFDSKPPYIWLYYEVVGRGTERLAGLRVNDEVRALGPLGNHFPPLTKGKILMIAGGRGIAPIHYAIKEYCASNQVSLAYGARSRDDLNFIDRIKSAALNNIFLYTDDGSVGEKGLVTSGIKTIIQQQNITATFSCGPDAMLEHLARQLKDSNTENHVSMEALMGCGFGICHSCIVKVKDDNYKKVCSDGPIFRLEEIEW